MIFTHFYKSDNHVTNLIWSQFSLKTEAHCVTKLALHHSAIYIETRKQCGPFAALPSTNIHHTFRAQRCPKNNNHNRNIFLADEREFIPGVFAMSSSLPPRLGQEYPPRHQITRENKDDLRAGNNRANDSDINKAA